MNKRILDLLVKIIIVQLLLLQCYKKQNLVDRTKATPKLEEFPTLIVADEVIELKNSPSLDSKSINTLNPGTSVRLISSDLKLEYIHDRVDKWIKIETNDKITGWSLSSKFNQMNPNISLIDFGDKCEIEIGNSCYFNKLRENLCDKIGENCVQNSISTIQFNDYVKIEKINENKKFVYVKFYDGNYKSGWIEANQLVSTNQLNIENPLAKAKSDLNDIKKSTERKIFSVIRNSINPIYLSGYKYPNSISLNYNMYFASKGELTEDTNILFGEIYFGKNSRTSRPAFLPKNALVESEKLEMILETKFPELTTILNQELITTKYPTNVCFTNETDKFSMFGFSSIRTGASHLTRNFDLITIEKIEDTYFLHSVPEDNQDSGIVKIPIKIISKDSIQIYNDIFIPINKHPSGPCPYEKFYSDD